MLGTERARRLGARHGGSARGVAEVSGVTWQGGSQQWGGSALLQLRKTDKMEAGDSQRRLGTDTAEAENNDGSAGVPAGHSLGGFN